VPRASDFDRWSADQLERGIHSMKNDYRRLMVINFVDFANYMGLKEKGHRNIWAAEGPEFKARHVTSNQTEILSRKLNGPTSK